MSHPSPLNIAIIGPSGAGKGTHAASLSSRFGLRHVATGDLFREHVQGKTPLGLTAQKYMEHGDLVPDEVVDAMVDAWYAALPPDTGALLDGFPRTSHQAHFLDKMLRSIGRSLDAVIYLHVPDREIIRRLSGRFICRNCQEPYHLELRPPQVYGVCDQCGGQLYHRPDDSTDMVNARLRVFHRTTNPLLDYFAAANKLIIVSGDTSIPEVEDKLVGAVEGALNSAGNFATREDVTLLARPSGSTFIPSHRLRSTVDIVLLGGPGSGKGTQAARLCQQLKLPHVATGDLFRENLHNETETGKLAKAYMDRGELVPDDVTEAMIVERLGRPDVNEGFLLDGFPSTLPQAHALTEILARQQRRLSGVIYIKVSDEVLMMRLSSRLICRQCQAPYHSFFKPPRRERICDLCGGDLYRRTDDNPKSVHARLSAFHHQTEPLLRYYRHAGLLHEVDGEDDVDEISMRVFKAILEFAPKYESLTFAR